MRVRWQQYEIFFGFMVFLFMAWKNLKVLFLPHEAINLPAGMTYLTYIVLPFLLAYGVPLALMILINAWIIPRYLNHKNQLVILTVWGVGSWLLFCTANTLWYVLKFNYSHPGSFKYFGPKAVGNSTTVAIVYLSYLFVRERIISWVNQPGAGRSIRVMICNRITAVLFLYTTVLQFEAAFKLTSSDISGIFYVFVVLPVIIIVFINLYALLPRQYRNKQPLLPFAWKLLIAPLILSLVCWLIYILMSKNIYFLALPVHWLLLVLLATPLSYLLFYQQKDKLVALQQLSEDLGKTTADLAFLRSQINPHFLFNSLNTLYGTALQENAHRTATGIQRLGDMMRFLLHDNHRDVIPLSRELDYLKNYITLQQLRIAQSNNIEIEVKINEDNTDKMIAPMLLIPFVENAFKHGIRLSSPSFIRIHVTAGDKDIYLHVANSLHPKHTDENLPDHSGVGLQNVQQRLELLYPGRHSLIIKSVENVFEAHLRIVIN
jgi:two-component system, LytTR family, sensor kinase